MDLIEPKMADSVTGTIFGGPVCEKALMMGTDKSKININTVLRGHAIQRLRDSGSGDLMTECPRHLEYLCEKSSQGSCSSLIFLAPFGTVIIYCLLGPSPVFGRWVRGFVSGLPLGRLRGSARTALPSQKKFARRQLLRHYRGLFQQGAERNTIAACVPSARGFPAGFARPCPWPIALST